MSEVVLGVVASHSTLMNTHWHEVEGNERAIAFRHGLGAARDLIAASRPDAVVIVGSNHFRGFWLDLMPAFTVGVGECVMSGESGTPVGPLALDLDLARHTCRHVMSRDFDVAFSAKLQVDHGITHAVQYLLDGVGVPVVPVIVNVFAPPLPSLARANALGLAVADAIAADGEDKRVVVIGSGGLSHRLPFPRWDAPVTDDDRFMVEAWTEGRDRWREYDPRRRQIIRAAPPGLNPDFDRLVLELVETGRLGELAGWDDDQVVAEAGNGGHELRTWLVAAGACRHAPGRTVAYCPMPEWLTGMAIAILTPEEAT